MARENKSEIFSTRIKPSVHQKLKDLAEYEELTISELLEKLILDHYRENEESLIGDNFPT